MKIKLKTLKCLRCGYEWTPRREDVRQCPKCKSVYWNERRDK
jgi:predicted Zn-ribbon and HTH transcriptional regulator